MRDNRLEKRSVNYRKQNLFVLAICMLFYGINRITKFHEPDENILKYIWDYNFTDFLCQLVYFSICNIFLESINKKGIYTFKTIFVLSAICCLYWEIGVLYTRTGTVFDVSDWIAYLLGAVTYYCLLRIIRDKKHNNKYSAKI